LNGHRYAKLKDAIVKHFIRLWNWEFDWVVVMIS
jgi:hypothetical protein